jgi:hypothetical protein
MKHLLRKAALIAIVWSAVAASPPSSALVGGTCCQSCINSLSQCDSGCSTQSCYDTCWSRYLSCISRCSQACPI